MDKVTILNMALSRAGVSLQIMAPDEASVQAQACNTFYDSALDRCLEGLDWNFARKYVALQDIGTPPTSWTYMYQYPSDCIKARRIISSSQSLEYNPAPEKFEVLNYNGGKAICTDVQSATLRYTYRNTKPETWPAEFCSALAWLLASDVAPALASKPEYAEKAGKAYQVALQRAIAADFNEGQEKSNPESEFVLARY